MEGTSLTPQQEKLKALQELLPEAFAEGKIDWEKLKATLGENINFANERYVLNWAGKSDAFKVLQTPSTKTLIPCPEESVKTDGTTYQNGETFQILKSSNPINPNSDNIFIEGENLEVLKVLQKSYFGKVKMIYIDPPYNTGNDSFIYPDKFSETKAEYEKRVGDKDEEGYMTKDGLRKNSKENGQYHSNWLNMMMPRLYLAKNLLTQDGVIFVSIDDNEVHNLRLLMNEIFGEENFLGSIVRATGTTTDQGGKGLGKSYDYILLYSKQTDVELGGLELTDKDILRYNLEDDKGKFSILQLRRTGSQDRREDRPNMFFSMISPDGTEIFPIGPNGYESRWRVGKDKAKRMVEDDLIYWKKSDEGVWVCYFKYYLEGRTKRPSNLWTDVEGNKKAQVEIKALFDDKVFDTPKPTDLIKKCLQISNTNSEIILDFFAGSGTTAHAVMELNKEDGGNRRYICVQMPELCDEKSEAYKAGYKTIAEISKERIRRAGKKINEELKIKNEELEKQVLKLQSELQTEETIEKISNLKFQISNLQTQNLGFKVLKLADSNFKQWQQIEGKDAKALTEQMQLFIDPVAENATIENMVYEFLLKSGKDLNSKIEKRNEFFVINNSELILLLESVSEKIIEQVIAQKPMKVIALDKLFTNNDQLKTNTVLQMRDTGIEFKTI